MDTSSLGFFPNLYNTLFHCRLLPLAKLGKGAAFFLLLGPSIIQRIGAEITRFPVEPIEGEFLPWNWDGENPCEILGPEDSAQGEELASTIPFEFEVPHCFIHGANGTFYHPLLDNKGHQLKAAKMYEGFSGKTFSHTMEYKNFALTQKVTTIVKNCALVFPGYKIIALSETSCKQYLKLTNAFKAFVRYANQHFYNPSEPIQNNVRSALQKAYEAWQGSFQLTQRVLNSRDNGRVASCFSEDYHCNGAGECKGEMGLGFVIARLHLKCKEVFLSKLSM